jgi:divalent metal cation (Fe/Co/Zn/Cd) transporter
MPCCDSTLTPAAECVGTSRGSCPHLELDPEMTVRQSHRLAHQVQLNILARLEWVADVLVHVEPAP